MESVRSTENCKFTRNLSPILASFLAAQVFGQALYSPSVLRIEDEPKVEKACADVPDEHIQQLWAAAWQERGAERKHIVKEMRSWCKDQDIQIRGSYARCISAMSHIVDKRYEYQLRIERERKKKELKIERENKRKEAIKRRITDEIRNTCLRYSKQMDDDELVGVLGVIQDEKKKGKARQDALDAMLMLCVLENLGGVKGKTVDDRVRELAKRPEHERLACRSCYELLVTATYGPPGPPIEDVIFQARSVVAMVLRIPVVRLFGQNFPKLGDPSYRARDLGNGRYQVDGLVKIKNAFGVEVWNDWTVIVLMKSKDSAKPLYLKFNGDVVFDER